MKCTKLAWMLPMSAELDILQKKPNKVVAKLTENEAKSNERRLLRRLPRGGVMRWRLTRRRNPLVMDTETALKIHGHKRHEVYIEEMMTWAYLRQIETLWIKMKVELNTKTHPMRRDSVLLCSLLEPRATWGTIA